VAQRAAITPQQAEHRTTVAAIVRNMKISEQTLYRREKQFVKAMACEVRHLEDLEEEHARLLRLAVDFLFDRGQATFLVRLARELRWRIKTRRRRS
jgi:hypothetical protein